MLKVNLYFCIVFIWKIWNQQKILFIYVTWRNGTLLSPHLARPYYSQMTATKTPALITRIANWRKSWMTTDQELLIYTVIMKPIWTQVCSCGVRLRSQTLGESQNPEGHCRCHMVCPKHCNSEVFIPLNRTGGYFRTEKGSSRRDFKRIQISASSMFDQRWMRLGTRKEVDL